MRCLPEKLPAELYKYSSALADVSAENERRHNCESIVTIIHVYSFA